MAAIERFVVRHVTSHGLAVGGLIGMAVLLGPGIATLFGAQPLATFDYNGERNVPALFSAGLLIAAGLASALWSSTRPRHGTGRAAGRMLAFVFCVMALDEAGQMHEKLERIVGIDWQVLYVPVMAAAGIAAVLAAIACPDIKVRLHFLGGAVAWGLANLLELAEYDSHDHRVLGFTGMVFAEENLEMLGSLFFAVAMMMAFELARAAGAATAAPRARVPVGSLTHDSAADVMVTSRAAMRATRRDVDWP